MDMSRVYSTTKTDYHGRRIFRRQLLELHAGASRLLGAEDFGGFLGSLTSAAASISPCRRAPRDDEFPACIYDIAHRSSRLPLMIYDDYIDELGFSASAFASRDFHAAKMQRLRAIEEARMPCQKH